MSLPPVPHAALLIDFDNVTMGIRSDLSKELKSMLSSEIIKGKVAVQRAYADWRRYPQYIVPLAESSVDLIFAPAYGSSKKNATDIRLAIDALELVFTRPEIGTFILLSGDSDFSSLVLKLKEYGKYVIGVGIRESASDLLVQNCDEYYSYSALTGLTRAGDEPQTTAEDPWELVELAIKQMAENNDVMRSDRLKQVILEMDPSFDEKALGFQKFNRFMQEAAGRGLVALRKLENGQFEVGLPGAFGDVEPAEDFEQKGNGRRRTRRGRGRDRDRDRGRDRERAEGSEPTPRAEASAAEAPAGEEAVAAPEAKAAPAVEPKPVRAEAKPAVLAPQEPGTVPTEPRPTAEAAEKVKAEAAPAPAQRGRARHAAADPLADAYALLRRAVSDVVGRGSEAARDSDIKRRMLELEEGWDESALGFSKFSRFLRQAHDAEVINLRKLENGSYEAVLAGRVSTEPERIERPRGRDRDRDRSRRGRERPQGELELPVEGVQAGVMQGVVTQATRPVEPKAAEPRPEAKPAEPRPAATAPARTERPAAAPAAPAAHGLGMRRGSRGRMVGAAPPLLLEGQTVPSPRAATAAPAASPAAIAPRPEPAPTPAPANEGAVPAAAAPGRRTRGRGAEKTAVAEPPAAPPAAKRTDGRRKRAEAEPAPAAVPVEASPLAGLGLPSEPVEVVSYLTAYQGVGPKSAQSVVDAFGASGVFEALQNQPDRVREIVGGARGERLIEAWQQDYAKRMRGAQGRKGAAKKTARGGRGRGRRGGRPAKSEA